MLYNGVINFLNCEEVSKLACTCKRVGKIVNYLDKIGVAILKVEGVGVKVGDTILIGEKGEGFEQVIESMQVEHEQVKEVKKGDDCGLKVDQEAHKGRNVYKVT